MNDKILIDEDTRDAAIANALMRHNARRPAQSLDVLRVGDEDAPPTETPDEELVEWAAAQDRILVSHDANTLIDTFHEFVRRGGDSPGLVIIASQFEIPSILEDLILICLVCEEDERRNRCHFIPLK